MQHDFEEIKPGNRENAVGEWPRNKQIGSANAPISLTTHRCQYISMTCSSIDVDPAAATYAPACDHMVHAALQSHCQGQPRQQGVKG